MSNSDFGSGDFTLEGWIHIPIERKSSALITHTTEYIDGVLFVVMRQYDASRRLEHVRMTRADLVKG